MRDVYIVGVSTTRFGKHLDKGIKELTAEALWGCLGDCELQQRHPQAAWFSNSSWGDSKGQSCIRGQVALRPLGIHSIPITNVENACASGSTALHAAWFGVAGGLYDTTLAIGVEKLHHPNKMAVFAGFLSGIDIENCIEVAGKLKNGAFADEAAIADFRARHPASSKRSRSRTLGQRARQLKDAAVVAIVLGERLGYDTALKLGAMASGDHSPFMDVYASVAREHMRTHGSTIEQLAAIAAKNHGNGALNPNAQYRTRRTVGEVLADRLVSYPLTRAMCAPIGDGAAAAILCSAEAMRQHGLGDRAVKVRASVLGSGSETIESPSVSARLAKQAYEQAAIGPEDIDLAEVHDATAFGELMQTENLGFCAEGEGGVLAERGDTAINGKIPINPSGGLIARGHPVGASGLGQLHELVTQLRGEATGRQVNGARLALAENGGGYLGHEEAAMGLHLLEAPARAGGQR